MRIPWGIALLHGTGDTAHNLRGPLHSLLHLHKQSISAESLGTVVLRVGHGKRDKCSYRYFRTLGYPSRHASLPTVLLCILTCLPFTHCHFPLWLSFSPWLLKLHSWFSVTDWRWEGTVEVHLRYLSSMPPLPHYNSRWAQWQIVQFDSQVTLWLSLSLFLPVYMLFPR